MLIVAAKYFFRPSKYPIEYLDLIWSYVGIGHLTTVHNYLPFHSFLTIKCMRGSRKLFQWLRRIIVFAGGDEFFAVSYVILRFLALHINIEVPKSAKLAL